MKRIAISLICPLVGALLMTSCLGSDDEVVSSSDVALLSFSIKDLKTVHTIQKENGEDSTYTTVLSGSAVPFTIDQTQHLVYNKDSLIYGTNITRVLVNVTADGGVVYRKPNGEFGPVEDSIDFTNPVEFRVTSYDEQFVRYYTANINVHQVDPKKSSWIQLKDTNFPALNEQKAFVKGNSLYVIGVDAYGKYRTASTTLDNYTVWETIQCDGIEGTGLSVLLIGETFYLKTDAALYCSEDALAWTAVNDVPEVDALPGGGIDCGIAWFSEPLKTNEDIKRTIFVAAPETFDTCAQVWTKLSTESKWVEIEPKGDNIFGCPNLKDLAVIQYAGKMYAFGGVSLGNRKVELEAFSACYESRDNGLTWKVNEEALSLPEEFKGRDEAFSTATDGEYVWVMWSTGEVWRGRWNGLER